MFQNLQEDVQNNTKEETKKKKSILANAISKKYIVLYIITLMVSTIGLGQVVSPASLAMVVAIGANEIPIIIALFLGLIGNIIGCGWGSVLPYIIIVLIFFSSFFIREPKYNEESKNEKIKLGRRIFIASFIVGFVRTLITGFLLYDLFVAISMSMLTFILYKIFVNAITLILEFTDKRAFTLEEIIGASVLLTIAICCFGNPQIFGFSIRNIIAIFMVLVLGWKNGMLVGATSGVTIGVTLGIISGNDPVTIAVYSISGLIAGILNKFGKIGVIVGFILGDILLTYLSNGGVENLIVFKEILIAGIGLLAVPKSIKLDIENVIGNKQFLPITTNRGLDKSKETITKLKNMSEAVEQMANSYTDASKRQEEFKESNKKVFITELLNSTESLEDNILYDNISDVEGEIVNEIFEKLLKNQFIKEKDLIDIFAKNNNYIVGFDDDEKTVKDEVQKMTRAINSAYRVSKLNFVWVKKLKEEKKNVGSQLKGVSEAISSIAEDFKKETVQVDDVYEKEKAEIAILLKEKEILIQEMFISKDEDERIAVELYIERNSEKNVDRLIKKIIEKTLNSNLEITQKEDIKAQKTLKYVFKSADKYIIETGQAIAIKDGNSVSGDSLIHSRLQDGKHLLAISDGMGSGEEARKSSQIVVNMLQKLLNTGFNKESSIDLINTNLLNVGKDVYATLDVAIVDLFKGNIEFIKVGSAPSYIKNKKKVQMIKSASLPTGIVQNISKELIDKKVDGEELVIMCSDGIIDSNVEYKNKALWVKYLIEDMETNNPQRCADVLLNEAVDNNYGKVKDDMSVLTFKIMKKSEKI